MKKRGFKFVGPTIGYAWVHAVGIVNDHHMRCFRRSALRSANYTDGRRPPLTT
jgi:DNA-3-methyladenine glycosylase I